MYFSYYDVDEDDDSSFIAEKCTDIIESKNWKRETEKEGHK